MSEFMEWLKYFWEDHQVVVLLGTIASLLLIHILANWRFSRKRQKATALTLGSVQPMMKQAVNEVIRGVVSMQYEAEEDDSDRQALAEAIGELPGKLEGAVKQAADKANTLKVQYKVNYEKCELSNNALCPLIKSRCKEHKCLAFVDTGERAFCSYLQREFINWKEWREK
jgi:hypothetical protein